jgi:hypothetical protein
MDWGRKIEIDRRMGRYISRLKSRKVDKHVCLKLQAGS